MDGSNQIEVLVGPDVGEEVLVAVVLKLLAVGGGVDHMMVRI